MLVSPLFIEVWLQILIPQSTQDHRRRERNGAEDLQEWRGFNTPYQCLNPSLDLSVMNALQLAGQAQLEGFRVPLPENRSFEARSDVE